MEILIKRKEFEFLLEELKNTKKPENIQILIKTIDTNIDNNNETNNGFNENFIKFLIKKNNPKIIFEVISHLVKFKEFKEIFSLMYFIADLISNYLYENFNENQNKNQEQIQDQDQDQDLIYLFNEMLFNGILWLFNFDKKKLYHKKILKIFLRIPNFTKEEIAIMENLLFFEVLGIYFKNKKEYKIAYDYLMKIPNVLNMIKNNSNNINNNNGTDKDLIDLINELEELIKENRELNYDDTELDVSNYFKKSFKVVMNVTDFDSRRNSNIIDAINNSNINVVNEKNDN
jgi:hypothetical protein